MRGYELNLFSLRSTSSSRKESSRRLPPGKDDYEREQGAFNPQMGGRRFSLPLDSLYAGDRGLPLERAACRFGESGDYRNGRRRTDGDHLRLACGVGAKASRGRRDDLPSHSNRGSTRERVNRLGPALAGDARRESGGAAIDRREAVRGGKAEDVRETG